MDLPQYPPSHDLSLPRGRAIGAAPLDAAPAREPRRALLSCTLEMTPNASISWTTTCSAMQLPPRASPGRPTGSRSKAGPRSRSAPCPGRCSILLPRPSITRSSIRARERCDLGALAVPQTSTVGPARRLGAGVSCAAPHRHAGVAQGHGSGRGSGIGYRVAKRRHADTIADHRSRLGLVPRLRRAVRRGGALPGVRRAHHIGLSLQSGSRASAGGIGAGRIGVVGAGSTHAWTEIFLPGAGWITFDRPTGPSGGYNLIPLAVGRVIAQVMPMSAPSWHDGCLSRHVGRC